MHRFLGTALASNDEEGVVLACPVATPPPPASQLRCRFPSSAAAASAHGDEGGDPTLTTVPSTVPAADAAACAASYDPSTGRATCRPPRGIAAGAAPFVLEDCSSGRALYRGTGEVVVAGEKEGEASSSGQQQQQQQPTAQARPPPPSSPSPCPFPSSSLRSRLSSTCGGALLPYSIISLSYILFTTTDGAVRMIVLLHAYALGFSAMELAGVFAAYEAAGVAVNLLAGMAGSRFGIKATLLAGLTCQLGALALLAGWQTGWSRPTAILYVTLSQILNGVAKDLTKLGGKTVTKLVTPDEKQSRLFKLVALVTGMKNSAKGLGYLLGSALLSASYLGAIGFMAVLILAAYPWAWVGLDWQLGRSQRGKGLTLKSALTVNRRVGTLSLARFFLFASRDLWFEITLPYFLRDPASGIGWSRVAVGAFLACWIVCYGQVQSWSPQLVLRPLRQSPPNKSAAALWAAVLAPLPAAAAVALVVGGRPGASPALFGAGQASRAAAVGTLTAVLYLFCVVFAVNSAVHSYLVVRYAEGDKVASTVGFYYMSNAAGRLVGTVLSGAIYDFGAGNLPQRFGECLAAAAAFAVVAAAVVSLIGEKEGEQGGKGLRCGPCLSCLGAEEEEEEAELGNGAVEGGKTGGGGDEEEAAAAAAPTDEPPKEEVAGR